MSKHFKPVIPFWSSESKFPPFPRFDKLNVTLMKNPKAPVLVTKPDVPFKPKRDHTNVAKRHIASPQTHVRKPINQQTTSSQKPSASRQPIVSQQPTVKQNPSYKQPPSSKLPPSPIQQPFSPIQQPFSPIQQPFSPIQQTASIEQPSSLEEPSSIEQPSPSMTFDQAQDLAKEDMSTFQPTKLIEKLWDKRVLAVEMMQLFSNSPEICDSGEDSALQFKKKIEDIDAAIATISAVSESLKKPAKIPNYKIPKCFFVGQYNTQFKTERWYEDILGFIEAFEQALADQDIELVWREYIPVSFSKDLKPWVESDILTCESWCDAKRKLYRKFMSAAKRLEFSEALMNCSIEKGEVIDAYTDRFMQAAKMAGYEKEDKLLGQLFFHGLPVTWRSRVHQYLLLSMGLSKWTVENVYDAVRCVYGRAPYSALKLDKVKSTKRKFDEPAGPNPNQKPSQRKKLGKKTKLTV